MALGGVLSEEFYVAKASAVVKQPNAAVRFIRETIGELRKVNWPTRAEATNLTLIVVAVSFSMALFLGFFDAVFTSLFDYIINLPR